MFRREVSRSDKVSDFFPLYVPGAYSPQARTHPERRTPTNRFRKVAASLALASGIVALAAAPADAAAGISAGKCVSGRGVVGGDGGGGAVCVGGKYDGYKIAV